MDLASTHSTLPTGAAAGGPDNGLLQQLAVLDSAIGRTLPRRLQGGGVVAMEVPAELLLDVARTLRDAMGFEMLTCVSGVDMVDHLESIYHFRSIAHNWLLQIRVKLPTEHPRVASLVSVYASANWLERETYDLFGIVYEGHPDLRRILLDDDFFGYPLLKSFRPTPLTVHDPATTQTAANLAVTGEAQQRHMETITNTHLGQGEQERLHPGKLTFGSAAVFKKTGQGVVPVSDEAPNALPAPDAKDEKDAKSGPAAS